MAERKWSLVAARSFEAFPLFGLDLKDYDSLFAEKLDLLLRIRKHTHIHWSGKHRASLNSEGVFPRPVQNPLPVWLGVEAHRPRLLAQARWDFP